MLQFVDPLQTLTSASGSIETAFLEAGRTLEESIEVLAKLTSTFEAVLEALEGDDLGDALKVLSRTAARVSELGEAQVKESARFDKMGALTGSIGARIAQMKASLKEVDALAINARIAVAGIHAPGVDFSTFADEIARTLDGTKRTLDDFSAELRAVHQRVTSARASQVEFETFQRAAANSITERLLATVKAIALRHERAARSGRDVKLGSARVRQRICNAIPALQIGDITRQRLEHGAFALGLAAEQPDGCGEQRMSVDAIHQMLSAQLTDAARDFDRDVHRINSSLSSLAAEARSLRGLGHTAYGAADRDGGGFIMELGAQVGEALALLDHFDTARAEVAQVTDSVSQATAGLCGHLERVQSLEADIRIMGLNTTFKCARIGRNGLALSLIAQELRTYASGFAKEAGALMREVEVISEITAAFGDAREPVLVGGARAMRDAHDTISRTGQVLDVAVADLERDSACVVTSLVATVADLEARYEIGEILRDTAARLSSTSSLGRLDLASVPPAAKGILERMADGYTMANERAVHDRMLGRTHAVAPTPPPALVPRDSAPATSAAEVDDFLF